MESTRTNEEKKLEFVTEASHRFAVTINKLAGGEEESWEVIAKRAPDQTKLWDEHTIPFLKDLCESYVKTV